MKPHNRNPHRSTLTALSVVALLSVFLAQAGDTKPFKEVGQETVVTDLAPGALQQPIFQEARSQHGLEIWAGVIHQFSVNNVGGRGASVAFETVHLDAAIPGGVIIYIMKHETVANGDQFVAAGHLVPRGDDSFDLVAWLIPELGTGRFAGATGEFTTLRAIPGGYVLQGRMATVGAAKAVKSP